MIDLRGAVDGRGLRIMLGGGFEVVVRNYEKLASIPMPDANTLHNVEMLARVYRLMVEVIPRHSTSCSNQNVVDPLGAYRGASQCGCTKP